jgi:Tol biopolymer transport system component
VAGKGQGHKELYLMNPDGSVQRLLARDTGLGDMAWSPDGREIAFLRMSSENPGLYSENPGLYVVKTDGSGERRLTRYAQGSESAIGCALGSGFDWAPDGPRIAFTRGPGHMIYQDDLYVMNADGSGQRRLVKSGVRPRWSPDGQQISFMRLRDGNWEIYVMNADGSGQRRLAQHTWEAPAWSPDGRKIAFARWFDTQSVDIYVMNDRRQRAAAAGAQGVRAGLVARADEVERDP